jgi:hypothetical protein
MAIKRHTPKGQNHKGANDDLSPEYLHHLLAYDPETGSLTWKVSLGAAKAGKVAGWLRPDGRRCIAIDGTAYRAHRIIWAMQTGDWPEKEIDHIDLDPSNNRWGNLREATSSQNQANRPIRRNNASGYTGVCFDSKRQDWIAYINKRHIGHFRTKEEAAAAREEAMRKIHREFSYQRP